MDLSKASNVLDRWINAACRSLVNFVRAEMGAYRLYTVVPYLLKFIDSLTNIYVRGAALCSSPLIAAFPSLCFLFFAMQLRISCYRTAFATADMFYQAPQSSAIVCCKWHTPAPPRRPRLQVRYNRKRLKGSKGAADCSMALASLFHVLLDVTKVGAGQEYIYLLAFVACSQHVQHVCRANQRTMVSTTHLSAALSCTTV